MTARVGVYGGTFNPIHLGHLRAATEVAEALGLERVVFVPSGQPPHKRTDDDDPIAPAEQRLGWVREAVALDPRFSSSTIEVDRAGPSFLVDTLGELGRQLAPARVVFLLGRDAFQDLGSWREPRRLLTLADFAVTTRPGSDSRSPAGDDLREWLPEVVRDDFAVAEDGRTATHREAGSRIELVSITALDISATDLRARVRAGGSLRYLVPEAVRESIEKSSAFAPANTSNERAK